ncbi:hydroxyacid dehydrogenase [Ruania rhizosphaerae]|uniref:hydroxyacid dehydrogenase n=1 Tax=Ruania rhizosphaerae TaxID=1840413 RepID=UPI00135C37FE|nr:hydroxyacid dehydrogenase [Ruania rhizosphaerae]
MSAPAGALDEDTTPAVAVLMEPSLSRQFFGRQAWRSVAPLAQVWHPGATAGLTAAGPGQRERTEVVVTGWGSPPLTAEELDLLPHLRYVVHTGGSIRKIESPALWERGIRVSSQAENNAVAVAEYTLAMVILSLKSVQRATQLYQRTRRRVDVYREFAGEGVYGRTVGLLGASRVGRVTARLLQTLDVQVLISDPYLSTADATALGAELVSLEDLARRSDVLSLHVPALPSTHHLVDAHTLALLRDGATVINTARGSVLDTEALAAELRRGRLRAVLDVTEPLVPAPESELWGAPDLWLTPHVAGAYGADLRRLGDSAAQEVGRALRGEHLHFEVDPHSLSVSA